MIETDLLRILVGASALGFAAVTDLRWRRAPDATWLLVAAAGLALLAWDAATTDLWADHFPSLVAAGFVLVLAIAGYFTGLITGGADAKALASFALLAPLPLQPGWTVPLGSQFPLVMTMLMNGLLVAVALPFLFALANIARGEIDGARTFLAFKRSVDRIDQRVLWPLEYIDEDGTHVKAVTPRGVPLDAFDPAAFLARGVGKVWVTPKVPFLVPLWFGLVAAVLVGDPMAWGLGRVLG